VVGDHRGRPELLPLIAPRLVIAGASSGVGKTTITVGLIRALGRRGLRVRAFKCGPDYLDPTYLSRAAGVPAQNLDGWMMGRPAVEDTFLAEAASADISIIEGVMGLFDGASPTGEQGSTAELAKWLASPVLLIVDASGMARSLAALAKGFGEFDPEVNIAALVCNRIGSPRHLALLQAAVQSPPVLGGLERQPELAFPERHLGLRTADEHAVPDALLDAWADRVESGLDLDRVIALARAAPPLQAQGSPAEALVPERCRIGVAWDEAFHFYYADNLRRLERLGARLVKFSPIATPDLPPRLDGLYIGGGYPELHAARLASNASMARAIVELAQAGAPIYAECGGLMYLARGLTTLDGVRHPMLGLIGGEVSMRERLVALGYVEVETRAPSILGASGLRFRGHQFRYSELTLAEPEPERMYALTRARGGAGELEGFGRANVLGSYVHAHWASNPRVAEGFVAACADYRRIS
jgi:cobyrinic acid a,c-diamide synthase